jgi:uncharacterized membrane protein YhaH (DUF805 family)
LAPWFSFQGRINRTEYLFRISVLLCVASGILGRLPYSYGVFNLFLLLLLCAVQWLLVASGVKRWHDTGHGWMRGLGNVVFLPWLLVASSLGSNEPLGGQYGTAMSDRAMSLYWVPIHVWLRVNSGAELWRGSPNSVLILVTILFLIAVTFPAFEPGGIGANEFGANQQADSESRGSARGRLAASAYAIRICLCLILVPCIYMLSGLVDHFLGAKAEIRMNGYELSGELVPSIGGLSGFIDLGLYFALLGVLWLFVATVARRWVGGPGRQY